MDITTRTYMSCFVRNYLLLGMFWILFIVVAYVGKPDVMVNILVIYRFINSTTTVVVVVVTIE